MFTKSKKDLKKGETISQNNLKSKSKNRSQNRSKTVLKIGFKSV